MMWQPYGCLIVGLKFHRQYLSLFGLNADDFPRLLGSVSPAVTSNLGRKMTMAVSLVFVEFNQSFQRRNL